MGGWLERGSIMVMVKMQILFDKRPNFILPLKNPVHISQPFHWDLVLTFLALAGNRLWWALFANRQTCRTPTSHDEQELQSRDLMARKNVIHPSGCLQRLGSACFKAQNAQCCKKIGVSKQKNKSLGYTQVTVSPETGARTDLWNR